MYLGREAEEVVAEGFSLPEVETENNLKERSTMSEGTAANSPLARRYGTPLL